MKRLLFALIFLGLSFTAAQAQGGDWSLSRAEFETRFDADSYEETDRSETHSCHKVVIIDLHVCAQFLNDRLKALAFRSALDPREIGQMVLRESRDHGEPVAYYADNTQVPDMVSAVTLATRSWAVLFRPDGRLQRLIMGNTERYPGDPAGTLRVVQMTQHLDREPLYQGR